MYSKSQPAHWLHVVTAACAFAATVSAQTVTPATTTEPADPKPAAGTKAKPLDESKLELPVFEVSTERDLGYASNSTLSGTRTNEELKNIPASISVLNRQFLDDIAAVDIFKAVEFSLGAENTNQTGAGVRGDSGSGNSVVFRGIQNNWQARDNFQWYVPSDVFNVERIESNRGPTGQLYGDAVATGILNISTKQATTGRKIEAVSVRVDDNDSRRFTIDVNRAIGKNHALRLNLVGSDLRDWQDTAMDKRWGYALATQHKFFDGRTTLRLNGEMGEINRVQGTSLQLDQFGGYTVGTGSTQDTDLVAPGVQNPAGTAIITGAGNVQRWTLIGGQVYNLESTGAPAGGPAGRYYRQSVGPAGGTFTVPESIIPREQQWNGPSNRADRDYDVISVFLDHRFASNFYVELAYNRQTQQGTNTNVATFNNLRRDPNPFLPSPTAPGTEIANPYYNELYVEHIYRRQIYTNHVDNYRATAVYDLEMPAGLQKWIGNQRLVGTYAYRDDRFDLVNSEEDLSAAAITAAGLTGPAAQFRNNGLVRRHYLKDGNGDQLRYAARADTGFVSSVPVNTQATNPRLKSYSLNSFGAFLGDRIRTSVGVRHDSFDQGNGTLLTDATTGLVSFVRDADGDYVYTPVGEVSNTSWNYGAVWHARPWLSVFYNYAETFQFNASGTYFNGDAILPRLGDGFDYGVRVNLLENRLNFVATLFDNTAENARITATTQAVADEINNLLDPATRRYIAGGDTLDTNSKGYEFELVTNLQPNWTLRAGWSYYDRVDQNFAPRLAGVLAQMKAQATAPSQYALTEAQLNALIRENPRTRNLPTIATRYNFVRGPIKGAFVGGNAAWRKVDLLAGRSETYVQADLLLGYGRRFGKVRWSAQLNVQNLLDKQTRLSDIPSVSYLAPRAFVLTNTFQF
jgi:outer membrane receptor protein involved in Fe transport